MLILMYDVLTTDEIGLDLQCFHVNTWMPSLWAGELELHLIGIA